MDPIATGILTAAGGAVAAKIYGTQTLDIKPL